MNLENLKKEEKPQNNQGLEELFVNLTKREGKDIKLEKEFEGLKIEFEKLKKELENLKLKNEEQEEKIKEQEQKIKELEKIVYTDELTQIPNYAGFKKNLYEKIKWEEENENLFKLEKTVFGFIDLNNFKAVNDNFGHDTGDDLLKEVAEILNKEITKNNGFVSRKSGDEFVFIIENSTKNKFETMIKDINKHLEDIKKKFNVSLSIGIYDTEKNNNAGMEKKDYINKMINGSDLAMYKVKIFLKNKKTSGGNFYGSYEEGKKKIISID